MDRIYFRNLNGLRFFAAFAVIIHHIEQYKSIFQHESYFEIKLIKNLGNLGVQFFFVLSGFLITYLLIAEKNKKQKINYKNFVLRRVLRIWPVYFIVVIFSLFIAPKIELFNTSSTLLIYDSFYIKIALLIFFLPNILFRLFTPIALAAQTWSIGVEEQFYIIWPILIQKIKSLKKTLIYIMLAYILFKTFAFRISVIYPDLYLLTKISRITNDLSISSFILGALGSYIFINKISIIKIITNINTIRISFLLFILLLVLTSSESYYVVGIISIENEIFSLLFIIFILNLINTNKIRFSFENKTLLYLGKISYGLYMYHPLCIVLTFNCLESFELYNSMILYIISLNLTIALASISYHIIEEKFLKLKKY